jgi:hypothetical protein
LWICGGHNSLTRQSLRSRCRRLYSRA